jgi:hypothetical protein
MSHEIEIGVLKHHEFTINVLYPGITDFPNAYRCATNDWIPRLKEMEWFPGIRMYRNLHEKLLAPVMSLIIVAVNTKNYYVIQDQGSQCLRNKDLMCGPCGNLVFTLKHGFICIADLEDKEFFDIIRKNRRDM